MNSNSLIVAPTFSINCGYKGQTDALTLAIVGGGYFS